MNGEPAPSTTGKRSAGQSVIRSSIVHQLRDLLQSANDVEAIDLTPQRLEVIFLVRGQMTMKEI